MEVVINSINFLLIAVLILFPLFLIRQINKKATKNNFILYILLGSFYSAILFLFLAWWQDQSVIMLLKHFGGYTFHSDSNSYQVDYANVLKQNIQKVQELEKSYMGIGWPLKAIFSFVYYIPYLFISYYITYPFIVKLVRKK
jgi:hypothetical protein